MAVRNVNAESLSLSLLRMRSFCQRLETFKSQSPTLHSVQQILTNQFLLLEEAQRGLKSWSWQDLTGLSLDDQASAIALFLDHYSEGMLHLSQHMQVEDQLMKVCEERIFGTIFHQIMPPVREMLADRMDRAQLPLYVAAFYKLSGFISGARKAETVSCLREIAHIPPQEVVFPSESSYGAVIERKYHFLETSLQLEALQSYYSKAIQEAPESLKEKQAAISSQVAIIESELSSSADKLALMLAGGYSDITKEEELRGSTPVGREALFKEKYGHLIEWLFLLEILKMPSSSMGSQIKGEYRQIFRGHLPQEVALRNLRELINHLETTKPATSFFQETVNMLKNLEASLLHALGFSDPPTVTMSWRYGLEGPHRKRRGLQGHFKVLDSAESDFHELSARRNFLMTQSQVEEAQLRSQLSLGDVPEEAFDQATHFVFCSMDRFIELSLNQKMELLNMMRYLLLVHKITIQAKLKFSLSKLDLFCKELSSYQPALMQTFQTQVSQIRSQKELDIQASGLFPVEDLEEESIEEQQRSLSEHYTNIDESLDKISSEIRKKFEQHKSERKEVVIQLMQPEIQSLYALLRYIGRENLLREIDNCINLQELDLIEAFINHKCKSLKEDIFDKHVDDYDELRKKWKESQEKRLFDQRLALRFDLSLGSL